MNISRLAAGVGFGLVSGWLFAQPPGGGTRITTPEAECADVDCVATGVDCESWGTECEIGFEEAVAQPPHDGKKCSPSDPQFLCEILTVPAGNCVSRYTCWFQDGECTTNWFDGEPLYSNDCATFEF